MREETSVFKRYGSLEAVVAILRRTCSPISIDCPARTVLTSVETIRSIQVDFILTLLLSAHLFIHTIILLLRLLLMGEWLNSFLQRSLVLRREEDGLLDIESGQLNQQSDDDRCKVSKAIDSEEKEIASIA